MMAGEFHSIGLSVGISVQEAVSPVLNLFTTEGFAPLLASGMVLFAFLFGLCMYAKYILPGKNSLRKVLSVVSKVKGQEDFKSRFHEIDASFENTPLLRHGWSEFSETLLKPSDEAVQVIRNTIRPGHYLNTHEIETALRLKSLHFISNLLVGIGLLLTFLGLVAALTEAGHAIGNGSNSDFQEPIKNLLAVAAFKFWTSVSGLGCSIALRIYYEIQHNSLKRLVGNINANLERGLQFVTPEYLAMENLKEAQEQSAAMRRFSQDLAMSLAEKIQQGFTTALTPVHESLNDIGNRITGGIGDAVKNAAGSEMQQLATNMGGIVESLNASRTEMDGMGTAFRASMAEAAEALKRASGEASNEMSEKLQNVMASLTEESRKQAQMFDESMRRLAEVIDQAGEAAGGTVTKAATDLASGINGVSDGVRDAATAMAERMEHLSGVLQIVEERMNAHVQTMDALTGRARDTEQAMGATSRHLSEAAMPITQATTRMATTAEQLKDAIQGAQQAVSDSHQNLSVLSAKMSETQQTLQNAWQAYDQRFAGVDESLAKAVQGIVENVRDNVQSMEKFVREMDQTLGQTVTNFAGNIEELAQVSENFEEASSKLLNATDRLSGAKMAA